MKAFESAVNVLELLLKFHPCGLAVMLGKFTPPDVDTWRELIDASRPAGETVKTHGGAPSQFILSCVAAADEMDRVIATLGGWRGVREATEAVRTDYPIFWLHFVRHLDKVEGARGALVSNPFLSPREEVANELKITPRTLTEHRYKVPRMIVRKALNEEYQRVLSW